MVNIRKKAEPCSPERKEENDLLVNPNFQWQLACKQESLTSNNKTKLTCQLKLCNSPFVMDLDQGLCCFVCFKACMFIARGVEVIVGFTASAAGA